MSYRMFSVIGESLNFGGRRIGLIARVAWLPVLLLLITDLAATFAYLSVISGESATFSNITNLFQAKAYFAQYAARGISQQPVQMAAIFVAQTSVSVILIASFMAPLIRYAGLGERLRTGLVRLPFGPDQLRFMVAGLASFLIIILIAVALPSAAGFFVVNYIAEALSQTRVAFPDPDSLHTIELVTVGKLMMEDGTAWIYDLGAPLAFAAPFALLLWLVGVLHFHPQNRSGAGEGGHLLARAALVLLIGGAIGFGLYSVLKAGAVTSLTASTPGAEASLAGTPVNAMLIFAVVAIMALAYLNIRLYPWPGVVVCRRFMALGGTLGVSKGWNLFRLGLVLFIVAFALYAIFLVINLIIFPNALATISSLYQLTAVSTRLVNSGATAEWVTPLFVWIWNGFKILLNFAWTFFSYGVIAALYGRLYRESEAGSDAARAAAPA